MTDLHELDAVAQSAALRAGQVSPVELVEHYLDRIDRYGRALGAFVTVAADRARSDAQIAERTLTTARRQGAESTLPPLYGVPTAIKDLTPTRDERTTFGSAVFADLTLPAEAEGHVATLLRDAGTISLGKTNAPEFGLSAYTESAVGGSARTPWDATRTAGGSSGGAAAAVSAGLVPFAHGNDGGGSIRIPASACGVFGFKPSRGVVSNGPLADDITGMLCQGPLSRTVRDAAAMLDILAVQAIGDEVALPPRQTSFTEAIAHMPRPLRIGRYVDTIVEVAPECRVAVDETTALLRDLGHDVVDLEDPFGAELVEPFMTTWAVRSLRIPVPPEDEHRLQPATRYWRDRGRTVSAEAFLHTMATLRLAARRAVLSFDDLDAVLTPTLGLPPQHPEWFTEPSSPEERVERQHQFTPYTAVANVTGAPAASLPLCWSADGLPIGVMLAGRPAGDTLLLSLCAQLEAARPWAHRWPTLSTLASPTD